MATDKITVISKGGKNYEVRIPPNRLKMIESLARESGETVQKYVESLLDYAIEASLGSGEEGGEWAEDFNERAGNVTINKETYDILLRAHNFARKHGFKSSIIDRSGRISAYKE